MAQDNKIDDSYQGPGRVTAALGTSDVYSVGGGIVGTVAGTAGAAALIKKDNTVVKGLADAASKVADRLPKDNKFVQGFGEMARSPVSRNSRIAAAGLTVGVIAAGIGSIVGLVKGWGNANKGKAQFEDAKSQLEKANIIIKQQQEDISAVKEDVRTRFTDTIRPHSGGHGGHAAAYEAEKSAAQTQAGRA